MQPLGCIEPDPLRASNSLEPGRPGAYSGMLDFGHRSCKCGAIYLRSEGMASTRQIDSECSPLSGRYQGKSRHNADMAKSTRMVESRCGAVALGRTYLFPPFRLAVPYWFGRGSVSTSQACVEALQGHQGRQ